MELWLKLLNSDYHDYKGRDLPEDHLNKEEWLSSFIAQWQDSLEFTAQDEIRDRLRVLRTLIRRMADDFASKERVNEKDLAELNKIFGNAPSVTFVEDYDGIYHLKQRHLKTGIDVMLSEIAATFADVLVYGDPSRIRICRNPDCFWIFYDKSKNQSRKWCEGPKGCGNLMKVRRHRARKKPDNRSTRTIV